MAGGGGPGERGGGGRPPPPPPPRPPRAPEPPARGGAPPGRAHRALGCADFSRTDIRLSADGVPYVLEINPLPCLSPLDSNFPLMTSAAGLSHHALIRRIVDLSINRHHTISPSHPRPAPVRYGT